MALFSINAWAHTRRAPTARPIKANYLNIVTIRPLYTDHGTDPMPKVIYIKVEVNTRFIVLRPQAKARVNQFITHLVSLQ